MTDETSVVADDELNIRVQEAHSAWRRLGLRLQSVPPAGWLRFLLVLGAFVGVGWLVRMTWLGLIPFILGGIVAYLLLPVVNWLDRILPRWFASLVTMLAALGFIIFFISQFVPFMVRQATFLAAAAPSEAELLAFIDEVDVIVGELPAPIAMAVDNWLAQIPERVQEGLNAYIDNMLNDLVSTLMGLFDAVAFVFGFVVVPTWLLTVLNEQRKGRGALNRLLPAAMQADFWGVLRVIDRIFSTFVRGQLLIAFLVGLLSYLGLLVVEWLVQIDAEYLVVLAMFSGIMAFIPTLGPILGSVPIIILGLVVSPETSLYLLVMYIVVWQIIGIFVAPVIEQRIIDIHPALLIVIIVMVSELGLFWVLLAAPVTAMIRDLFRYAYGRLSEPPRPAGLLPGEPWPKSTEVSPPVSPPRIPLVYQHGRDPRRTRRLGG